MAQNNLDIALVRGGDQVVLKKPKKKRNRNSLVAIQTAHPRTRVRSRAMSTALRKIFAENQRIFIMGHRYPDMDALGSALGWLTWR